MPELAPLPPDYAAWLAELKTRIHSAQQRATLAVNRELVLLYWQIGRDIRQRQEREGWGAKVIERLAQDLRGAFPDMKGFSPRNLKYMRAFAEAWPDESFVQEVLAPQLQHFRLQNGHFGRVVGTTNQSATSGFPHFPMMSCSHTYCCFTH